MGLRSVVGMMTLALTILVVPLASGGQQRAHIPRLGFLSDGSPVAEGGPNVKAFRQGLRELGWVEGQNLVIEYRWAEGRLERLPELAGELVRLPVDIIVATRTPASQAAKNATTTIPIVSIGSSDPVVTGLVASLARPGGNLTGPASQARDLSGKRLEFLKEAVPTVSRVAVMWNVANTVMALMAEEVQGTAKALGDHPAPPGCA
jgi:putative ABC transport system substrate-binding protein